MINHGLISGIFDDLAELQRKGGSVLHGDAVHPSVGLRHPLHVKDYRTVYFVGGYFFQHKRGFLLDFLRADRLTVKIYAHLDAGLRGALDIRLEILVLHHLAAAVPTVSHSDKGKFHAVLRHKLPVNFPLMPGHVNPLMGNHRPVLQILILSGFQHIQICRLKGMHFQVPVDGNKIIFSPAVYNQVIGIKRAQRLQHAVPRIQAAADIVQHLCGSRLPCVQHLFIHLRL